MTGRDLAWLTARPIAHRGLHDPSQGVIENSISAARAAIAAGFGVECDVQLTSDGELVVFHDETLERLTDGVGAIATHSADALSRLRLRGGNDAIPRFSEFLAAIGGRTPLVVEIKSAFDGDTTVAQRTAQALARYDGHVAIESFDPDQIAFLRARAAALGIAQRPLGVVGEAHYGDDDWPQLSTAQRAELTHFLHYTRTLPDFLSWRVRDLPHAIPLLLRDAVKIPVTTWTVRSPEMAARARAWTDQIVFEGFAP
ncbi:MAG: glycerophosphodiester phosphodiesterase family protein [Methylocystis sp.]|uniref:glycerophosphodiester phosphodiesterase family protein n=1 Tax=Methylocystis sp. TaxID=1911079 RepID=UPI003D0DF0D8